MIRADFKCCGEDFKCRGLELVVILLFLERNCDGNEGEKVDRKFGSGVCQEKNDVVSDTTCTIENVKKVVDPTGSHATNFPDTKS